MQFEEGANDVARRCGEWTRLGSPRDSGGFLLAVFAATSVPLSFLGAPVEVRTDPARLERLYGAAISLLGIVFLIAR